MRKRRGRSHREKEEQKESIKTLCKQVMQFGLPFPLFRRFGRELNALIQKQSQRKLKQQENIVQKNSKVRKKKDFEL